MLAGWGMADEQHVAASVMEGLFRAAQQGRFSDLAGRGDLWRLLMRMTACKVVDLKRREGRQRRLHLTCKKWQRGQAP
jgi:hypothetical protein